MPRATAGRLSTAGFTSHPVVGEARRSNLSFVRFVSATGVPSYVDHSVVPATTLVVGG
jgi:hypothetical protein